MFLKNAQEKLNWDISKQPVFVNGSSEEQKKWNAIVRVDHDTEIVHEPFHICKKSYNPPTISELEGYCHELIGMTGFEMAGFQEIKNGAQVFAYLKNTKGKISICGNEIDDYLLLGATFDGTKSFFIGTCHKILRCSNEFGRIEKTWKVRNTSGRHLKTEELISSFELINEKRKVMIENFERFRKVKISEDLIVAAENLILNISNEDRLDNNLSKNMSNKLADLRFSIKKETSALGDNMWGLFNGITWHTSHNMTSRNNNAVFGNVQGDTRSDMNNKIYNFGLELIAQ